MKKIKIYGTIALLLAGVACDDFGDTNVSPNASTTPLTSALLTNALSALGSGVTGGNAFNSGLYCQYFSQTQYVDASLYSSQDGTDWAGEFSGSMFDMQNIININSDPATAPSAALNGSNNNQIAIARILKAFRFSVLTDRYGDMPYFEALNGTVKPVFNTQEDIYNDLFKELSEAYDQFDNAGNVKGDIMYGGDNAKWKKFANSLRLVLALRVSEVDETLGKAQFLDALADGTFESNADNALLDYPGAAFKNPWFALAADQAVSTPVADVLNSLGDQRMYAFAKPVPDPGGDYVVGFDYGLKREDAVAFQGNNPGWSLILNDDYRDQDSRFFILTYADALLARAEAASRGWTTEDEIELYSDAIAASWEQWGVFNQSAFDSYIENPDVELVGDPDLDLPKIGLQRWLTFYPNGPQGWSEWRRTGFPALEPTPNAVNTSKEIPLRIAYPSSEYGYNKANIDEAAARIGGDVDSSPVWWDVD